MDEDEEVLLPNSEFHRHLQNAGYSDIETTTLHRANQQYSKQQPHKNEKEAIDSTIMEEMQVLRASNLLFEDDLDHIDNIFGNYELNRNEHLINMFRGTFAAVVVAVGLCCYVFVGGIAYILVSAYYAYRTSDYLWRKHRRLKRLKRLMAVIQTNFSLVNRLIKFLYDSESLLKSKMRPSQRSEAFIIGLKCDYVKIQSEMNRVFADATTKLLDNVQLVEYVDSPETYDCQLMNEFKGSESVSQLYNIYMLLQSQFLTRLIFSIVPNLLLDPKNSENQIEKIISKVLVTFENLEIKLNTKLKFALLNGVSSEKDKESSRLLPEKSTNSRASAEIILRNVHDLSNSLQYCLLKSRELEGNLENGNTTDPEPDLAAIDAELSACRSHISDIFIKNKKTKFNGLDPFERVEAELSDYAMGTRTELGFSDLDPKIDDDIFEAFIDSNEDGNVGDGFGWDDEEIDPLVKKKQREMLGELKARLKPQADDWARRENMVFARKGVAPLTDVTTSEESRTETPLGEAIMGAGIDKAELAKIIKQQNLMDRDKEQTFGDSSSDDDFNGMDPSVVAEFFLRHLGDGTQEEEEQNYCYSGDESD